jgi:hypothetical protein
MSHHAPPLVPELVPARMLNESVYCPRVFYLEWVDGLWEENADTARGGLTHSPIDHKKGRPRKDGKAWEPEETQIAAQVLVLRENGYRCERATSASGRRARASRSRSTTSSSHACGSTSLSSGPPQPEQIRPLRSSTAPSAPAARSSASVSQTRRTRFASPAYGAIGRDA